MEDRNDKRRDGVAYALTLFADNANIFHLRAMASFRVYENESTYIC